MIISTGQNIRRASLAFVLALVTGMVAQTLPTTPPAGYDQAARFPAGMVQMNISYWSSVAGRNLVMHVYTPPGYSPNQRYGVVYCYQGIGDGPQHIFMDTYIRAHIVADNLIGEGKIRPVIVVALDDQFNGNSSDVAGMTIRDAIPFVDARYSTYADADHRGVYGYSWGGGYAFNVGCENLDVFHHVGPTAAAPNKHADTTLFPNGGADAKQKLKSLFFSWGGADYDSIIAANRATRQYCQNNGIPHFAWEIPGGGHWADPVWRPAFWNFLQIADRAGISTGGGGGSNLPPANGTFRIISRHSGKAMDAYNNGTANGTQIIQWTYGGGNNQRWTLQNRGSSQFSIIGVSSGKALDVNNVGTANGTKVQLWTYGGGNNQKFTFAATNSGYHRITPVHASGSCLDVTGNSTADGANVQLWIYGGGNNQQWALQAP
jgi:enterochelin esterase-like enzyme